MPAALPGLRPRGGCPASDREARAWGNGVRGSCLGRERAAADDIGASERREGTRGCRQPALRVLAMRWERAGHPAHAPGKMVALHTRV